MGFIRVTPNDSALFRSKTVLLNTNNIVAVSDYGGKARVYFAEGDTVRAFNCKDDFDDIESWLIDEPIIYLPPLHIKDEPKVILIKFENKHTGYTNIFPVQFAGSFNYNAIWNACKDFFGKDDADGIYQKCVCAIDGQIKDGKIVDSHIHRSDTVITFVYKEDVISCAE